MHSNNSSHAARVAPGRAWLIAGAAAIATLAYRLINYWLALPIGGVAWLWHRRKVRAGAVAVPRPARAG